MVTVIIRVWAADVVRLTILTMPAMRIMLMTSMGIVLDTTIPTGPLIDTLTSIAILMRIQTVLDMVMFMMTRTVGVYGTALPPALLK